MSIQPRERLELGPCTPEREAQRGVSHRMVREVREHPVLPGFHQDRMLCEFCQGVLYPWETFKK